MEPMLPARTRASKVLSTPPLAGSAVSASNGALPWWKTSLLVYSTLSSGAVSSMRPPRKRFQRQRVRRAPTCSSQSSTVSTTASSPSQKLIASPGRSVSMVGSRAAPVPLGGWVSERA